MEAAKIDWASLESVFVVDQVYEEINAPQWVDFLAPHYHHPYDADDDDDDEWFCRRDCKHPKTAEDFLKSTPTSKLLRSVSVSKLMGLGDWSSRKRDANLKRRGQGQGQGEDSENQDPNYTTPPPHHHHKSKSFKEAIKSSAHKEDEERQEKEEDADISETSLLNDNSHNHKQPPVGSRRLKGTLSAKDLFGGKDIFGKITDFCNELKKMASTTRPKDGQSQQDDDMTLKPNPEPQQVGLNKARKPFTEVTKDRYEPAAGIRSSSSSKQKLRKNNKKFDEAENNPVFLDLKNVKRQDEENLLPIRTNPPTPQGFSAIRDTSKITPSKGPKSRLKERDIVLQELEHNNLVREEEGGEKSHSKDVSPPPIAVAGKEGRALDVFWFLKPCTL